MGVSRRWSGQVVQGGLDGDNINIFAKPGIGSNWTLNHQYISININY